MDIGVKWVASVWANSSLSLCIPRTDVFVVRYPGATSQGLRNLGYLGKAGLEAACTRILESSHDSRDWVGRLSLIFITIRKGREAESIGLHGDAATHSLPLPCHQVSPTVGNKNVPCSPCSGQEAALLLQQAVAVIKEEESGGSAVGDDDQLPLIPAPIPSAQQCRSDTQGASFWETQRSGARKFGGRGGGIRRRGGQLSMWQERTATLPTLLTPGFLHSPRVWCVDVCPCLHLV